MSILIKTPLILAFLLGLNTAYAGTAPKIMPLPPCSPPQIPVSPQAGKSFSSLTVAADEILFALLGDQKQRIISLSPLAADPAYSNISQALSQAKLRLSDKVEVIAAAAPDIVIAASWNRIELLNQLKKSNIRTLVQSRFDTIKDIKSNIVAIGIATDCQERAQHLVRQMEEKFSQAKKIIATAGLKGKSVLVFSANLFFPAKGTLFTESLSQLGLVNLTATKKLSGWPKLSAEFVSSLKPDYLFVALSPNESAKSWLQKKHRSHWQQTRQRSKIVFLSNSLMTAASHSLGELAESIANELTKTQNKP